METETKIFLCVGSAVLVGTILYFIKGLFASIFGFIGVLLIWGLFTIWRKSQDA